MASVKFYNVVTKDGQTAAQRFAALTKESGAFYKVADTGEEVHYYLEDQLISADKAAEISVLDADGNFTGTNVESVLAELAGMVGDQEVTVTKTTGGSGDAYAYRYEFSQGGTPITNGTIDILKDMVATSGTVVYPSPEHPIIIDGQQVTSGTYIEMVIANGDPFYINVVDLIEYNTFVDTDEFTFADNNHQITVTVGKIDGDKIIYQFEDDTVLPVVPEITINAKVDQVEDRVADLETYVGTIPVGSSATDVIGYVDEKTGAGVSALNSEAGIASVSNNVVTIKGGVVETEGLIENSASAARPTVVTGYLYEGKFYEDQAHTTEITPVTTSSYQDDNGAGAIYNWTGHEFVLVRQDIVLEEVAVTGAAADVSIADAGSLFTATTVEGALAEIGTQLTWVEV